MTRKKLDDHTKPVTLGCGMVCIGDERFIPEREVMELRAKCLRYEDALKKINDLARQILANGGKMAKP